MFVIYSNKKFIMIKLIKTGWNGGNGEVEAS